MFVFRQLPQRILWKWEVDEEMPDLPSNVKLARWLPQQDILGMLMSYIRNTSKYFFDLF